MFSVQPTDAETYMKNGMRFVDVIGLYHYSPTTNTITKHLNWNDLNQKEGDWLYQDILTAITKVASQTRINLESACLGLYCCRNTSAQYLMSYPNIGPASTLLNKRVIVHEPDDNIVKEFESSRSISPCLIQNLTTSDGWNALANRTDQGCGMNLISYFGLISQNDAREITVCLRKGTSIIEICRYINDFLRRQLNLVRTFMIRRHALENAIAIIVSALYTSPTDQNGNGRWASLLKIYKTPAHKEKFSNVGHSIALCIDKENNKIQISFVDPQLGKNVIVFSSDTHPGVDPTSDNYVLSLCQQIRSAYPSLSMSTTAVDIIYIVDTPAYFGSRFNMTNNQLKNLPEGTVAANPVIESFLYGEGVNKKKKKMKRKRGTKRKRGK
jgi:hypothetical protein